MQRAVRQHASGVRRDPALGRVRSAGTDRRCATTHGRTRRRRLRAAAGVVFAVAALVLSRGSARAVDLRFNPTLMGQVRDDYFDAETQTPMELYGDFGLSRLPGNSTFDTYFRLEQDFTDLESETDFFSGVLRIPNAVRGLDFQLGRQIVAESPIGLWDADSGQIRIGLPDTPYSMTVYGGQPRYWEPTFGPPKLSQDEQIFGTSLRVAQFTGGALSLGYLQQIRQGRELMQQVTLSGTRSFSDLPGMPSLYGNFAFDSDHANIDQVRVGTQNFVGIPELLMNFESGYYKPHDAGDFVVTDINRREDPIFQLFSVSDLLQFRGGLRYAVTPTISTFVDLSYQRYEQLSDSYVNGYVYTAGALFLPGGDGLEMVRTEYYGIDGAGGSVNGGRAYYENRVYEDILFRAKCDVGYYDKTTNQSGVAIASLVGVGYQIVPGLIAEVNFEANRNQLFPEDFRFGFFFTYAADYATTPTGMTREATGNEGRPWPWAPTQTGPASWGTTPVRWTANPGLPDQGWAGPTFQSVSAQRAAEKAKEEQAKADQQAGGAVATAASAEARP